MEKNIWSVTHLLDKTAGVLPFDEFCAKFNVQCNRNQYNKAIQRVAKNTFPYYAAPSQLPSLTIGGQDFSNGTLFTYTLYPVQLVSRNSGPHILSISPKRITQHLS